MANGFSNSPDKSHKCCTDWNPRKDPVNSQHLVLLLNDIEPFKNFKSNRFGKLSYATKKMAAKSLSTGSEDDYSIKL